MSSYYREHVSFPNVTSGPAPPYPPADEHFSNGDDDPNVKRCSVKGCATPLSPDYPHKMCEECRGRHRIYANTKRAKRKLEKALLNSGQPVAWIPDDGPSQQEHREGASQPTEPVAGPSRSFETPPQVPHTNDDGPQPFDFSQPWDPALDPRLFSQASELAGALTLPHAQQHVSGHELFGHAGYQLHSPQQHPEGTHPSHHLQHHPQVSQNAGPPPPPPAPEMHPVLAEVLKTVPNLNLSTRITSGPTVPVGASGPAVDGQLPPRFCSIKGCKTLIAGNSFFKMCEPCRDRYRNYGTTKRAKWRKEKEYAVIELQKLRQEEDARRAAQGLPPLPPDDDIWHEYAEPADGKTEDKVDPSPGPDGQPVSRPPRMCTVSHCREILPGDYRFLRCERHRIQNRHHSKLKRVRDKEVKAQVYDGWAAAVGVRDPSADDTQDGRGSMSPDTQEAELSLELEDIEQHLRDANSEHEYNLPHIVAESGVPHGDFNADGEPLDETPLGEPSHGVPPAARGTRRTNHVCSIRACANLLSPSNPWKMCDLCRSRDRAGRRLKALRDSGLIPPEIVDPKLERMKMEVEGKGTRSASSSTSREQGEKKSKKRKKKNVAAREENAADSQRSGDAPADGGASMGSEGSSSMSVPSMSGDGSNGSVAPSALQRVIPPEQGPDAGSSPSMFSFSVSGQSSIVFMDPISPEQAAQMKIRPEKTSDANVTTGESSPVLTPIANGHLGQSDAAETITTTPAPKKRKKGKGKAKDASIPNAEQTVSAPQATVQEQAEPAAASDVLPIPPAGTDSQGAPHYPGYSYFMQPHYMPTYPPPPNYGYPYSPPKGSYPPPPPMYQPPYGPYPYPYPGQPYAYPAPAYPPPPGHPYPPPPLPGQSYTPMQPPAQPGQPYPPYPYHPYPPPPSYQSSPPPQHAPAEQAAQPDQHPPQPDQPPEPPITNYDSGPSTPAEHQLDQAESSSAALPPPASSEAAQKPRGRFSTFIVRTEEAYQNGLYGSACTNAKRKRDDGREPESGVAYSKFRVDPTVPPVSSTSTDVQPNAHVPHVFAPAGGTPPVDIEQASAEVDNAGHELGHTSETPPKNGAQVPCSNKNCKRVLPVGVAGSLCDRCKERLKKRQVRAKHRFKLEPKSLLGRSASAQPGGSGTATPAMPAVMG
ncbi:hypothetical protein C2E23DRAFT_825960 [Lenzites betulinus]|nr:hypothetical protein C2E23DRAFT_825960 [Lenzites betulinus]